MTTAIKRAMVIGSPRPKNQLIGGEKRSNRNSIVSMVRSSPGKIKKYFLNASNIKVRQIHEASIDASA
jgi:hypothetical protein